ncbi:MAG: hypothetical protein ACK4FB_10485 [Brevundimonas sp.]|uniref:hypothetical protein n=1 Tax=Brevundimonas sp. TaxID=1871086 RepID=UPI00391B65FC
MSALATALLTERLLWPVPRVRWEAARGLARLIRAGDQVAREALLVWISRRDLESEVMLGLGVIDGFDLCGAFSFDEVSRAVKAPSFLSDLLLARNFADAERLFPFRYALSPDAPAPISDEVAAWFERYWHAAVPPVFRRTLERLEEESGWPFLKQWKHDWCWLQSTHPRPVPDRPYYFFDHDREGVGQIDLGQRELYISAYLRTLAHAALRGPLPNDVAEGHALHALTLTPGLATLRSVPAPEWATGRPQGIEVEEDVRAEALRLWSAARSDLAVDEVPLHLTVTRRSADEWLELELSLAVGRPGFRGTGIKPMILKPAIIGGETGEFVRLFAQQVRPQDIPLDPPLILVQEIHPAWPGRFHSDILAGMSLASPVLFGPAVLDSHEDVVRLRLGLDNVSTWRHWYDGWSPGQPADLRSPINSLTGAKAANIEALVKGSGGELGVWVSARHGIRKQSYSDYIVQDATFWAET